MNNLPICPNPGAHAPHGSFTIAEGAGIAQARALYGDGTTPFALSLMGKAFAALLRRVEDPDGVYLSKPSSSRPPFETFTRATCKGCYALGSACGSCEKCAWERKRMIAALDSADRPSTTNFRRLTRRSPNSTLDYFAG